METSSHIADPLSRWRTHRRRCYWRWWGYVILSATATGLFLLNYRRGDPSALAILLGTLFPIFDKTVSVGAPYFNIVVLLLAAVLAIRSAENAARAEPSWSEMTTITGSPRCRGPECSAACGS